MIFTLLEVVLPVFLVIGAGYTAARLKVFKDSGVDGLMVFTQRFAIPCLLFSAVSSIDLEAEFDTGLMVSFYLGAFISFVLGIFGARMLFQRRWGEAVAIGFAALFSNSVLLGLSIIERAFGAEALTSAYAIVVLHAPFCYVIGITVMEILRADGKGLLQALAMVTKSIATNALMIGVGLGLLANFTGFTPPTVVSDALDMMIRAALPAALFGLGGILTRYTIADKLAQVGMIALLSLIVHPTITWLLATQVFELPDRMVQAAVVTAAMAPGVNAYIFASMYNRAMGVNSSAVLLCTILSVGSATVWLSILP